MNPQPINALVAKNSTDGPEQAADARVKRRDQRAVRHEPPIGRGEARAHAAHRAGQSAEDHRRARRLQSHETGRDRRADHHDDRLDEPRRDAQRDHVRARADRRARHRADDVRDRARADGRHADGVGVAERIQAMLAPTMNGSTVPSSSDTTPIMPGLARLGRLHLERGRDDREIAQHRAAHQADAAEQRQVGQTLVAAGLNVPPQ